MKCLLLLVASLFVMNSTALAEANPLLEDWKTPFGAPPFDRIETAHHAPAIREAMRRQRDAIAAIAADPSAPTFANTIEALERSGELLARVGNVFRAMNSANTSDEIQAIARELAPEQSAHYDAILFDEKLFARLKTLHDARETLPLTSEQRRLLDRYYRDFVRGGALLGAAEKARLAGINGELSVLGLRFAENVLKETNAFELVIDSKSDLAGLPAAVVDAAAEAAARRGHEGKWLFTLHKPSLLPFLQYSPRRELRERIFKGYIKRGDNGGALDNNAVLSRIAALRVERAKLLGYETHAHFVLEESMAKEPKRVYDFLDELWTPALARGRNEARALQALIDAEGGTCTLEPWDWWYYAEKLRKAEYELDDETLRPYFRLENVVAGAFGVATKLWGVTFTERTDLPTYNDEVRVFEVKEADGSHIGILYTDYFPRDNKRGGAWCGEFRGGSNIGGLKVTPIITNCGNFTRPTGDAPSLLNFDEVTTLFHEFGHALHGLLTECVYPTLSGTAVATDFVELPSQIMENWALEPEVLRSYARHYVTDETIPPALVEKIRKSGVFNQGFATVEYIAACYLDMDWHTLGEPVEPDAAAFEAASLGRIGLIPEIVTRYRSPYFSHVFGGGGGYAAGYYSYIWAEVLDADAFEAFKETSLFDRATAESFRRNILAMGGADDPMELYKRFRGREPVIEPLLERRGLK
jgi:peptidyl-dipeptidase Dcp